MGTNPALTTVEEDPLVAFCIKLLKCGVPINCDDLMDIVHKGYQRRWSKNQFTNDRPGKYWFYGFMQRNHELTE